MSVKPEGIFFWLTGGSILSIPWLIVWMLAVMIVGAIVLQYTRFGYHVYATGGNLSAARDSGIDTNRVKLIAFAMTGGLVGLAAVLLFGYLRVAEPSSGAGFEFRVIGAVIVGGAALTGGARHDPRHVHRHARHRHHHRRRRASRLLARSGRHLHRLPDHRGRHHRSSVAAGRRPRIAPPFPQGATTRMAKKVLVLRSADSAASGALSQSPAGGRLRGRAFRSAAAGERRGADRAFCPASMRRSPAASPTPSASSPRRRT